MDWTRLVRERLADTAGRLPPGHGRRGARRASAGALRGGCRRGAEIRRLLDVKRCRSSRTCRRSRPRCGAVCRRGLAEHTDAACRWRALRMWSDLSADIRYATRLLLRNRGFAAAALLTVALGVGAATAIFSVVDAVLLRPLPYPDARRLVAVWETDRNSGTLREPASLPDMLDMRRQSRRLEAFGGVIPASSTSLRGAVSRGGWRRSTFVSAPAAARRAASPGPPVQGRRASGGPGRRRPDQ